LLKRAPPQTRLEPAWFLRKVPVPPIINIPHMRGEAFKVIRIISLWAAGGKEFEIKK